MCVSDPPYAVKKPPGSNGRSESGKKIREVYKHSVTQSHGFFFQTGSHLGIRAVINLVYTQRRAAAFSFAPIGFACRKASPPPHPDCASCESDSRDSSRPQSPSVCVRRKGTSNANRGSVRARDTNANMGYTVGEDGLSVQDADTLDASTLTPLSPEVISRQATINIGTCGVSSRATRFQTRRRERRPSRRAPRSRRP